MSAARKPYHRPLDLRHGRVDMGHGGGGRATAQLVSELFAAALGNEHLARGDDGAVLPAPGPGERLVMCTDAHVVSPLFFPGGDIGGLSVHGTVNDVAVMGARPLYLTAGFILEEGFPLADLARIGSCFSQAKASAVPAVTPAEGSHGIARRKQLDQVFDMRTFSCSSYGDIPHTDHRETEPDAVEDAKVVQQVADEHHEPVKNGQGQGEVFEHGKQEALHGIFGCMYNFFVACGNTCFGTHMNSVLNLRWSIR